MLLLKLVALVIVFVTKSVITLETVALIFLVFPVFQRVTL